MEKIKIEKEAIVLDETERKKLKHCLNYCYHRLMEHEHTGLTKTGVDEVFVDYMRKRI